MALFKMVFHLDVHYSSGKVVAGGAVAENAGNLHSYCPQELRTPTSHQSSERTRICAEVNIFIWEQMFPDGFFSCRVCVHFWEKYSPLCKEEPQNCVFERPALSTPDKHHQH